MQQPPRILLAKTVLQEAISQISVCLHKAVLRGPRPKDVVWATHNSNGLVKRIHTSHDGSRALCKKYSVHPKTSAAEPNNSENPIYVQTHILTPARVWVHTAKENKDEKDQNTHLPKKIP